MDWIQRCIQAATEAAERKLSEYIDSLHDDELLAKIFDKYDDIVARDVVINVAPLIIAPYHKCPENIVQDFLSEVGRLTGHNIHSFMNWYCDEQTIRDEIRAERMMPPT